MDVSLLHPSELDGATLAAWRRMRAADPRYSSPFLAPEFALAVGAVRDDARVIVVRDACGGVRDGVRGAVHGEVRGVVDMVLPVQVAHTGLARPLGAPLCDVSGPVCSMRGVEAPLTEVLARAGVASYVFAGWSGAPSAKGGAKLRAREGCGVADLSHGFVRYAEVQREVHAKHYKKMRRLARAAERDHGAVEVRVGAAGEGELAQLVAWKREQYARTRRHDVLRAEWTRGLLDACAAAHAPGFAGVMATLRLGGKLAAAEFGLRSGGVLHGWMAAYDPAFAAVSPGLLLQERLLERAAEMGVAQAVLGAGEMHYKKHYVSYMEPVDEGMVCASGFAGEVRAVSGAVLGALEAGPAARLAARTRRRLDVILAVETKASEQLRGFVRAVAQEPAVVHAEVAIKTAARASAY